MVIKSGTQKFHGALWEFNRNDAFDAGYYFFKQQNQQTPELRLNIFRGDIGGPVIIPHVYNNERNKTFFFVNEEWRELIQGANPSVTNTIPAAFFPTAGNPLDYTPLTKDANGNPVQLIVPATMDTENSRTMARTAWSPGSRSQAMARVVIPFQPTSLIPTPSSSWVPALSPSPTPPMVRSTSRHRNSRRMSARTWSHRPAFQRQVSIDRHWIHDRMEPAIYPDMWSNNSYVTTGDTFKNPSWGTVINSPSRFLQPC